MSGLNKNLAIRRYGVSGRDYDKAFRAVFGTGHDDSDFVSSAFVERFLNVLLADQRRHCALSVNGKHRPT